MIPRLLRDDFETERRRQRLAAMQPVILAQSEPWEDKAREENRQIRGLLFWGCLAFMALGIVLTALLSARH
jgi:hypothetical protein